MYEAGGEAAWSLTPLSPVDVFAAAAHLLYVSGGYQYIVAPFSESMDTASDFIYSGPTKSPSRESIRSWLEVGQAWARAPDGVNAELARFWATIWEDRLDKLVKHLDIDSHQPAWWNAAHALLVIADEACCDLGYTVQQSAPELQPAFLWNNEFAKLRLERSTKRWIIPPEHNKLHVDNRHLVLLSHKFPDSRCANFC